MLYPVLIISVIAGTCGRNYRRSKKGEQSQSEAHIEANGIYEFALFKHHKRGKDASPSAYLQGEFVKHIVFNKVAGSYVYKTPIIGHLANDHSHSHSEAQISLVLPISYLFSVAEYKIYSKRKNQKGYKMRQGPILKIALFSVTEEALVKKSCPCIIFHKFSILPEKPSLFCISYLLFYHILTAFSIPNLQLDLCKQKTLTLNAS